MRSYKQRISQSSESQERLKVCQCEREGQQWLLTKKLWHLVKTQNKLWTSIRLISKFNRRIRWWYNTKANQFSHKKSICSNPCGSPLQHLKATFLPQAWTPNDLTFKCFGSVMVIAMCSYSILHLLNDVLLTAFKEYL